MIRERENYNAFLLHFLERLNSCDSIEKKITESLTDICEYYGICNRLLLNILQVISQKYGLNL